MQFGSLFELPTLSLYAVMLFAQIDQSLCAQCFLQAKEELQQCLDAAISREDKTSCKEKSETRTQTCNDGECKIERAAGGENRSESPQERTHSPQ